ncbi:hypothetical protein ESZ50_06825 [Weissella muntiaci]|uniref:Uncharacterized protein n=1 Tax=Weissella muntiaci TaxID=2508881 RepID=A0A6C2C4R6_9LACO|nr:hypothetical protein [Weissella muntiaci]TYC48960.1 hypothetical protein ESZ50_06825 [Weissella muntiaci]
MNEQALNDLTLAHRSAWVRLVKTDQRAMQTWSVTVSYDQKDFLSQLGRQNVTWKVYSNKLMDEPVYVFNGMIDLMVDQSDLQVRDEITFTMPNQSFKPLDLIVSIKDQTGRELSAKQAQVVPNKPINLGQIQHQSFSLQHHYWNVIKPRNQRRSEMIWQGEGLVRNAQITVLGMRDQILTQGQEYDWRSSFIWPDLKGESLQGNVQIQSSTGINRLDTSKPGQYQIEGQILSPDGRIRATRLAYVEIMPRIISSEADSQAVLTREQFSKSNEMVISEQAVRFDQVGQQLVTQEIERPQITQVTETQEIERPQITQVTETQEIERPQITQVTETQEIAQSQIRQITETQEIAQSQIIQVTETQEIERPQIGQITGTQEIERPQTRQITGTQEIAQSQIIQATGTQEIAQSQIPRITEAREIVQPQTPQATGTQGIAQPQIAQVIENQEMMVTQSMKAVEGTQESVVVLLERKREIVFDEQKARSLSGKDLHKADNRGVVYKYKEERIKDNLSSTEAVNEKLISDKNIRQLPATDFVTVAQLSYLGMCLVLGALICGYKEK